MQRIVSVRANDIVVSICSAEFCELQTITVTKLVTNCLLGGAKLQPAVQEEAAPQGIKFDSIVD